MHIKTIESLLKMIKALDNAKQNKKVSEEDKLKEIIEVFNNVPLDIKAQLERMKQEVIKGIDLPKDFVSSSKGRYIQSNTLDMENYDDLLIAISGNFLEEDREKLTNAIVYKLNH